MALNTDLTKFFVIICLIDSIFAMMQLSTIEKLHPPFVLNVAIVLSISGCCLWYYIKKKLYSRSCYLFASIVLLLTLVGMFRGLFMVEGYWGYKGWVSCVQSAMSFVLLFPLSSPTIAGRSIQAWNKYIFPFFIFFGLWALSIDAYPFQIPFIYYFYVLLFPVAIHNRKATMIIIIGLVCTMISVGNRSAFVKAVMAIGLCVTLYLPSFLQKISRFSIHFLLYLLPIILLILGLTGTFNIFQDLTPVEPTETVWQKDVAEEQAEEGSDMTADTRTFLYVEVILSAIEGDYVLFGNSIGRGNTHGGEWTQDVEGMDSSERLMNEAHMLNVFTWTGLLGVILYSIMYLQASCLGLFCSKNRYVPLIACAVAFHWAMLWIEECPSMKPLDYALFLLLGICFSPKFRNMTDMEFRLWFQSCFAAPQDFTSYDALKKLKLKLLLLKVKGRK